MLRLLQPIRRIGGRTMSEPVDHRQSTDGHPPGVDPVMAWARCHPGILVIGSLALTALLTRKIMELIAEARPQTEADFVDGETPLFI
jgi:hypothetical protein